MKEGFKMIIPKLRKKEILAAVLHTFPSTILSVDSLLPESYPRRLSGARTAEGLGSTYPK